jgi:hypothetical protein
MRKPRLLVVPERSLTRSVASYLDLALFPGQAVFTHIASGGARDPRVAAQLKGEGVRRGAPDFVVAQRGVGTVWLELKTSTGKLRPEQETWAGVLSHAPGTWWALCRSVEEVEAALRAAGVPLRTSLRRCA